MWLVGGGGRRCEGGERAEWKGLVLEGGERVMVRGEEVVRRTCSLDGGWTMMRGMRSDSW